METPFTLITRLTTPPISTNAHHCGLKMNSFSMLTRLLLSVPVFLLFTQCASPYDMPKDEIDREFIVQLREVGEVKDVVDDLKKLKLTVERSIVPTMNIWLLKTENAKRSNEKVI